MSNDTCNEVENIIMQARSIYDSEDTKEALILIKSALKYYPKNPRLTYVEAVLKGEMADRLTATKKLKEYGKTAKVLKKLLKNAESFNDEQMVQLLNEYYWFSRQPLKQYNLGIEMVKAGLPKAYYCQGVGACELALKYRKAKKPVLAKKWAKESISAWDKFFKKHKNWYNAYCFYARANGYLGKFKEMETALKKAQKISGRSVDHYEFKNVRNEFLKTKPTP